MLAKIKSAYGKIPPVLQHVITAAVAALLAYYGIKG
jgi:hypothetical protein